MNALKLKRWSASEKTRVIVIVWLKLLKNFQILGFVINLLFGIVLQIVMSSKILRKIF